MSKQRDFSKDFPASWVVTLNEILLKINGGGVKAVSYVDDIVLMVSVRVCKKSYEGYIYGREQRTRFPLQ